MLKYQQYPMVKKTKIILLVLGLLIILAIFGKSLFYFAGNSLARWFFSTPPKTFPGLSSLPCEPASQVELGSPSLMNRKTAEFTTSGGTVYIKPHQFAVGGGFYVPSKTTTVIIGQASMPPVYDEQKSTIDNVSEEIRFNNNDYAQLNLDAGRYWLWVTGAGRDVVIYSCEEGGVSDPNPVR